jgi:hypothetical protein
MGVYFVVVGFRSLLRLVYASIERFYESSQREMPIMMPSSILASPHLMLALEPVIVMKFPAMSLEATPRRSMLDRWRRSPFVLRTSAQHNCLNRVLGGHLNGRHNK